MTFKVLAKRYKKSCEKRLKELKKKYPEPVVEKIYCYTSNGHDYWRVIGPDGRKHHLPKSEEREALRIIRAQIDQLEICDLENEIEACRLCLKYLDQYGGIRDKKMASATAAFKRLLAKAYRFEDARLNEWQKASYEKSTFRSDQLKIATSQGFYVRSKAEALIAEVLYRLGIPCRYEPVIYLNGERLVPDFMCMNPITFEIFYIEYNGMMDDDPYIDRYLHKTALYLHARIVPDINILYFHETIDAKIDMRLIESRIREFVFGNAG